MASGKHRTVISSKFNPLTDARKSIFKILIGLIAAAWLQKSDQVLLCPLDASARTRPVNAGGVHKHHQHSIQGIFDGYGANAKPEVLGIVVPDDGLGQKGAR